MVRIYLTLGLMILAGMSACGGKSGPTTTATPASSLMASPTATAPAEPRRIVLDTAPKPQPPEVTRRLGPPPPSAFPPWDGKSTVIYDTKTGGVIDLGPGSQFASFSPDETKAVWTAGGDNFGEGTEAFVVDLNSGQRRSLGPGRMAWFLDNTSVAVYLLGDNGRTVFDPSTGAPKADPGGQLPPWLGPLPPSAPPGYLVERGDVATIGGMPTFTVRDAANGVALLTFEAVDVKAAGTGEIAVAAPPLNGRSNIYMVELPSGIATFIASGLPGKGNWPFSASADAVLWTDGYCSSQPGPITYFDRKSGQLIRVDSSTPMDMWVRLTPGGLIATRSFGVKYLIDPSTMAYVAVIPNQVNGYGGDVSWSPGYRYASHGPWGGHGGLCGGE